MKWDLLTIHGYPWLENLHGRAKLIFTYQVMTYQSLTVLVKFSDLRLPEQGLRNNPALTCYQGQAVLNSF
jgi:hypothetical protein